MANPIVNAAQLILNPSKEFTRVQHRPTRLQKIIQIVALAALAVVAVAVAAIAGLVLNGVIVSVIAALSTALLITIAAVVYKILQIRQAKQDPKMLFKDFLETLGTVDPHMIVHADKNSPSMYVVHRSNGNVALITSDLWDPKNPKEGMELIVEFPESQMGDLKDCGIYQAFLDVTATVKRNMTKLNSLIQTNKYFTMEAFETKLPHLFLDPTTHRACMFLGIDSSSLKKCPVPQYFLGPNKVKIPLITAKLLTYEEWRDSQEFAVGKNGLARRFERNESHHTSNLYPSARIVQVQKTPLASPEWTIKTLEDRVSSPLTKPMEELGDISDYQCPIESGVLVNSFETTSIAKELKDLTLEVRSIRPFFSTGDPLLDLGAKNFKFVLDTQSELYGWQYASEFIRDPQLFLEKTQTKYPLPALPPRSSSEVFEEIDSMQKVAHDIVRRVIQRIEWVSEIYEREKTALNPKHCLKILATDALLMKDIKDFFAKASNAASQLESQNSDRFKVFRDVQKQGVRWDHAPDVRREIEKTGFKFDPMMLKRDRCICAICQVMVSGWRPWYDPNMFHDHSKHKM